VMDNSQWLERQQRHLTAAHDGADRDSLKPSSKISKASFYPSFAPIGAGHRRELT
jgi:hypothetical protein